MYAKQKETNTMQVHVISVDGRTIMNKEIQTTSGKNTFEINSSSWASGMYFLNISDKNGVVKTSKIIKQ